MYEIRDKEIDVNSHKWRISVVAESENPDATLEDFWQAIEVLSWELEREAGYRE